MNQPLKSTYLKERTLAIIMFLAGGSLMCVEVIAGLAIAPFFGSSVFVWGSVIGVFMGALSVGYLAGGKIAERSQKLGILALMLLLSGLMVLLVPWYGGAVCRALFESHPPAFFSAVLPLTATILLYFAPTALLGMITPFAVRLAAKNLSGVGTVVGRLYAWNALGSVTGGLVTTFILSTHFGTRAIHAGCALLLIAASVILWMLTGESATQQIIKRAPYRKKPRSFRGLFILVFTCGVAMMSFEIIAGAQIAPYFGSSVFVWGSVISTFLIAMTLGYRWGGKMVDRRPSVNRLVAIVTAAGFLLLLLPMVTPAVCETIQSIPFGERLNILRPLLTSFFLFFVPTMLFAMIAPFALRMSASEVPSIGVLAGKLYGLSTLGNVGGILLTVFLLIPLIGKTHAFELTGAITVLSALLALFLHHREKHRPQPRFIPALLLAAVAALVSVAKPEAAPLADADERMVGETKGWAIIQARQHKEYIVLRRLLEHAESPYHTITVFDEKSVETGQTLVSGQGERFYVRFTASHGSTRKLKFDRFTQSSLFLTDDGSELRRPYESASIYTDMLHLPYVFHPEMKDVLIIGGGAGVVPMIFRRAYPVSIDVVEIDPAVVKVAEKWFGLRADERMSIYAQDGRMFVHNARKQYDLIIVDVYTAGDRIPFHLTTREFLLEVKAALRPQGIVLINLISSLTGFKSELFWAELKTSQNVFGADHVYVFPERMFNSGPLDDSRNIMLLATGPAHKQMTKPEIAAAARRLVDEKRIPISSIPRHASNMIDSKELSRFQRNAPMLTDDYAPVDMMMMRLD
jgi:spermidine synthase/MFS family permease